MLTYGIHCQWHMLLCRVTSINVFECKVHVNISFLSFFFCFDRHVQLPKDLAKLVPKSHLMTEAEWRGLGVQQSQGWIHYMIHQPGIAESIFVCCVSWQLISSFYRASHPVVSTPHHHTSNGRKGIIKIGLANHPPESHQVRLKCVAIDNYSIWRFLFNLPFHLPTPVLCSTISHSFPSHLKMSFFFCIFLGFHKEPLSQFSFEC